MSSRIVPTNIDGTFPVAGQDNPSQGFRDNFTNIKNNFTFARNEISDLQDNVLLKSALAGTTLINDMAGTQIIRPQLKAWTQSLVDLGAIDGSVTVGFGSGNFQKLTTAGSISITLNDWPTVGAGGYGLVRLWVVVTNIGHEIILPSNVTVGATDIAGFNSATNSITVDTVGNYIFEFSSFNGGTSFLITDIGRNSSTQSGGLVVTGYQYLEPTVDFTANINLNVSRYIINPTTTIGYGNLRLPDSAPDGTVISISSTEPINELSVSADLGVSVKPGYNMSISGGTSVEYFYHSATETWYKVR